LGSKAVKLHLDTFHMNIEEKNQAAAILKAGKHLAHFHACGCDRGTPGGDHIDWKPIVAALKKIGYDYVCVTTGALLGQTRYTIGPNYQVPHAEAVKKAVPEMQVRAVGMIADPDQAEEIVASGKADMVAALLARDGVLDGAHDVGHRRGERQHLVGPGGDQPERRLGIDVGQHDQRQVGPGRGQRRHGHVLSSTLEHDGIQLCRGEHVQIGLGRRGDEEQAEVMPCHGRPKGIGLP
jgi:hypothetical protein